MICILLILFCAFTLFLFNKIAEFFGYLVSFPLGYLIYKLMVKRNLKSSEKQVILNTVDAHRISTSPDSANGGFSCVYEYEVNGEVFRQVIESDCDAPEVLTLYYSADPSRASQNFNDFEEKRELSLKDVRRKIKEIFTGIFFLLIVVFVIYLSISCIFSAGDFFISSLEEMVDDIKHLE